MMSGGASNDELGDLRLLRILKISRLVKLMNLKALQDLEKLLNPSIFRLIRLFVVRACI